MLMLVHVCFVVYSKCKSYFVPLNIFISFIHIYCNKWMGHSNI